MCADFSVSDFNNQLNTLKSLGVDASYLQNGSVSKDSGFINSIFALADQAQEAYDSDDKDKGDKIKDIVDNILGMLSSVNNESQKATQKIAKESGETQDIKQKGEQVSSELNKEIQQVMADVNNSTIAISEAMSKIEELGGEDGNGGQVAEAKKELEKQVQIIEENKAILNDGVSSIEVKREALEKIKSASSIISGLVATVQGIQKEIEAQNTQVQSESDNIANSINQSAGAIKSASSTLNSLMNKGSKQGAQATETQIEGEAKTLAGQTLQTSASTTPIIPVVGQAASQKMQQTGLDLSTAGRTLEKGSAQNISAVTTALGEMGQGLSDFSNSLNSVVGVANATNNLIGEYNSRVDNLIKATGSWTNVANVNTQLNSAVAEAETRLNGSNIKPIAEEITSQSNPQDGLTFETTTQAKIGHNEKTAATTSAQVSNQEQQSSSAKSSPKEENEIFNFDTSLYKKAFGV